MARKPAPFAWRKYKLEAPYKLPDIPACYAIYFDGELAYIGQTVSVRKRFMNYNFRPSYSVGWITPWGMTSSWNELTIKVKPTRRYGDWAMRELRLIRRLKPPLNCIGSVRGRRDEEIPWHRQTKAQGEAFLRSLSHEKKGERHRKVAH